MCCFVVVKFKRRHRYLEFFVQVAQKALTEGMSQQAADWCDETANWLTRYGTTPTYYILLLTCNYEL